MPLLQDHRAATLPSAADDSYEADPQRWIEQNADVVRQAFVLRSRHVLTCSDPRESPFGTIALPGLGIMNANASRERLKGLHGHEPIDLVRSHVLCKACIAFARRERIPEVYADETGMAFGQCIAEGLGADYEHSLRTAQFTGPVNNIYVDPTLCLGNPQDGGLPPGFKVSQIPLKSFGERWLDRGVTDPDETYAHVRLLLDVVEAEIPKGDTRAPFNVVLFKDPCSFDDSETLAAKMRNFGRYAHRPWQRFVEAWAPKRSNMRQEDND